MIAVSFSPGLRARRAARSCSRSRDNQFVEAERSLGASPLRLAGVHVVPNILAPLFIMLAMDIPSAITVEAGLSFLGLGVQPPTRLLGRDARRRIRAVRGLALGRDRAGPALMITMLAFTLLGETLRDVFDPGLFGARRWRRRDASRC